MFVQGRYGGSRGGQVGSGWRMRMVGFGFGVKTSGDEVPGGVVVVVVGGMVVSRLRTVA